MAKEDLQGVAAERREAERRWCWEMCERLNEHRKQYPTQPKGPLDINVRMYEVIRAIEMEKGRSWRKIFPEIIANRDVLHPVGRRLLLRKLEKRAKRECNRAIKAQQRAQRYEGFIEQLNDPKPVSSLAQLQGEATPPALPAPESDADSSAVAALAFLVRGIRRLRSW